MDPPNAHFLVEGLGQLRDIVRPGLRVQVALGRGQCRVAHHVLDGGDRALDRDIGPVQRQQLAEAEAGEGGGEKEGRVLFVDPGPLLLRLCRVLDG